VCSVPVDWGYPVAKVRKTKHNGPGSPVKRTKREENRFLGEGERASENCSGYIGKCPVARRTDSPLEATFLYIREKHRFLMTDFISQETACIPDGEGDWESLMNG